MTHAAPKKVTAPAPAKAPAGPKLQIGAPDDAFEREADRMADEIVAAGEVMHRWSFAQMSVGPRVQRECACGGRCDECKAEEKLRRKPERGTSGGPETAPASVHHALAGPGKPLDPGVRLEMGRHFGFNFSDVRVHCGPEAEQSARDVRAHAYTVGNDIVFGNSRFAPDTPQGRRLLAHELAHVVQQSLGKLQRTVQPQRCDHDGQATSCRASGGVWSLEDPLTNERFRFSIAERVLEGPGGLKTISGGGDWVREVQTPPNPRKKGKQRGFVDIARVRAGRSLGVEVVEVKGRSVDGGGCSVATYESNGYINALRPLAPAIVSLSGKLAAKGGFRLESGCVPKKAPDKNVLKDAGVDFSDADSANAWCFYNSLQNGLDRTFTTAFAGVDINPFRGGTPNTPYKVYPRVVINCRKTVANKKGVGYRTLQYMVNQEGGVSYGCSDQCSDDDEERKREDAEIRKHKEANKSTQKDASKSSPNERFNRLYVSPDDAASPGAPAKDPDAPTPTADTGESNPVALQPGGVSEADAIGAGATLLTAVAFLHIAAKANPASRQVVQSLITEKIDEAASKGAIELAEKLDGANITKYGIEAGDAVIKEGDAVLVGVAEKSPGFLAKFGPGALKSLGKGLAILGIVLTAKDALAGINQIRKGAKLRIGFGGPDVDLSGDTKVKVSGAKGESKGDVSLTDTQIDIETKDIPDTGGKTDIEADKVTISGPAPSNDAPVTINMKVKLSNATITFKNGGVYRDGRAVVGGLTISDSDIEIDLPPGLTAPNRKVQESRTISGVRLKITALGTGGGGGGAAGTAATPNVTPAHPAPAAGAPKKDAPTQQEKGGAERDALIKQITDDPNLHKLYSELAGKGIVPSDELLRRLVALAPSLKQHPKAIETVVQHLKPGDITDQIKQIIEPIERNIQQEEQKPAQSPQAPDAPAAPGKDPATQPAKPGAAPGASTKGGAATAPPQATAVSFDAIKDHLRWLPAPEPDLDDPPKSYQAWVEWDTGAGQAQRAYKFRLELTFEKPLTPGDRFLWQAEYSFSAPSAVITSEKGDRPIQFSDAGTKRYQSFLRKKKHPAKKGGGPKK